MQGRREGWSRRDGIRNGRVTKSCWRDGVKGKKAGRSFYGSNTGCWNTVEARWNGWWFGTRNLPLSYPRGSNDCSLYGWTVFERVCDKRPCKRSSLLTLKETLPFSRSLAPSSYAQYNYFLLEKVFFDASLSKHGIVVSRGTTRKRAWADNSSQGGIRGISVSRWLEKSWK